MKKVIAILFFGLSAVLAWGQGYRGFVGADFGAGQLNGGNYKYRQWVAEASTTHGYAFNDQWFAGGGIGVFWCNQDNEAFFPVYAAARYRFTSLAIVPYAEARVGLIAFNSVWKEHAQRIYLAGSLGVEVLPFLQVNGRLTYSQTPFGDMVFHATVGLAYSFGN